MRFDGRLRQAREIAEWAAEHAGGARPWTPIYVVKTGDGGRADNLRIRTLEGEMRAEQGDWIIRGVQGEFYPCKPDIFDATYEAVEA